MPLHCLLTALQMEKGRMVVKYSTKGVAGDRILYVDRERMAVAWRDLVSTSTSGHRRSISVSSLLKGDRVSHSLTALRDVRGGDEEVGWC